MEPHFRAVDLPHFCRGGGHPAAGGRGGGFRQGGPCRGGDPPGQRCGVCGQTVLASETKSLLRLVESAQQLARTAEERPPEGLPGQEALARYARDAYLSGVLLLDGQGQVEAAYGGDETVMAALEPQLQRDALLDVTVYPKKTYAARVPCGDGSYVDLAACGRKDGPGAVAVYYHTPSAYIKVYTLSVQSLVEGYRQERDGTVVVTQDGSILASNDGSIVGKQVDEVTELRDLNRRGQNKKMLTLDSSRSGLEHSFGILDRGRNYYVYVYMTERDVFSAAISNFFIALFLYAILLVLTQLLRWNTAQRYQEQQLRRERSYQQSLKEEAEKAEQANRAKTEFLQRMSHDIRTPINGIRGMVEIGNHYSADPEKQAECRQKIWEASGLLLELVNEVLDMGKLESGEVVLEERSFNVLALLKEMRDGLERSAAQRGVTIYSGEEVVDHPYLIGSPLHLKRLLMNILSNAIKYNKENGSVTLSCREVRTTEDTAWIRFDCADTGIGMSEEFQKHLFEPFTQEGSDARSTYGGTGLGMAITKSLVDKMGGTIEFESKKGEGTAYHITIPFRIDPEAAARPAAGPEGADISLDGMRILVAEDNPLNMEITEFFLKSAGAALTKAENGQEALERFKAALPGTFDAILMDVMMPVLDGYQAARAIRALDRPDAKTVPIIALTANAFAEDALLAKQAGMNAHITKPIDEAKLKACLAEERRKNGGRVVTGP